MTAQDWASANHGPPHRRASSRRRRRPAPCRGRGGTRRARRRRQRARGHGRDGRDGFWLVRAPSGRVRALMAAGRAGANARRELYRDYETIPPRGALAAVTVPAAVGGWMLALEAAGAHGGRLRLGDLLAPAIAHAREGAIEIG